MLGGWIEISDEELKIANIIINSPLLNKLFVASAKIWYGEEYARIKEDVALKVSNLLNELRDVDTVIKYLALRDVLYAIVISILRVSEENGLDLKTILNEYKMLKILFEEGDKDEG